MGSRSGEVSIAGVGDTQRPHPLRSSLLVPWETQVSPGKALSPGLHLEVGRWWGGWCGPCSCGSVAAAILLSPALGSLNFPGGLRMRATFSMGEALCCRDIAGWPAGRGRKQWKGRAAEHWMLLLTKDCNHRGSPAQAGFVDVTHVGMAGGDGHGGRQTDRGDLVSMVAPADRSVARPLWESAAS